ncbi:MAG: hypothetical protein R3B07_11655 [Polyangiaceae bacterium]
MRGSPRKCIACFSLALLGAPSPARFHHGDARAAAPPTSTESKPVVPPGWRAELGITGMWLPRAERSFNRHAQAFRFGAGYSLLSFGLEYAHYHLPYDAGFSDDFSVYLPWAAVNFDLGGSLRASLEAAIGFGSEERSSEEPIVPRVRASLQFVQSYFAIGPLVGYGLNLADGHQDSHRSYDAVPFGIEVGGMLSVWLF